MMAAAHPHATPLEALLGDLVGAPPARAVTGIALDSRRVAAGGVFMALPGHTGHGLDHLDDALARGAGVVLYAAGDPSWSDAARARCEVAGAIAVAVPELQRRAGELAARFHGSPAAGFDAVVAVTGTDGKTSVSHYIAEMLDEPDAPAGVIGTLGRGRPGATSAAGLTTPDAVGLQEALAALAAEGVRRVALEASSHGLAQYRLDGTRIDVAVLTQLGRDHLDFHSDAAAYAAAKARLFAWPGLRAAVLNLDDAFGRERLAALPAGVRPITYGRDDADLEARAIACEPTGLRFELRCRGHAETMRVPLLGAFNVDNLLAAAGALLALDHAPAAIAEHLTRVRAVPGRMELYRVPGRAGVVIDYAHNAGALASALAALRAHAPGRLWCVFGAGGERDRGKRPLMGAAAAAGADHVVVTDDNPRGEDPGAIVADILEGVPAGTDARLEHDRGRALALALEEAGPDDLVLLAGKGHETTQTRGATATPWSDRDAARQALGLIPREGP